MVQAGQLDEKLGDLKQEVMAANQTVAKLQKELQATTGQQSNNPWGVGVPYGSKAARDVGVARDKYGRPVGEKSAPSGDRGPRGGWQR